MFWIVLIIFFWQNFDITRGCHQLVFFSTSKYSDANPDRKIKKTKTCLVCSVFVLFGWLPERKNNPGLYGKFAKVFCLYNKPFRTILFK